MEKNTRMDNVNRCRRCNRKLKDEKADYGWRCAEILGISQSQYNNENLDFYNRTSLKPRNTSSSMDEHELEDLLQQSPKYYQIMDITDILDDEFRIQQEKMTEFRRNPMLKRLVILFLEVRNGSAVDLKNKAPYKDRGAFIYEGEIVDQDALGNILFGYLGKHLVIPDEILCMGAGGAQMLAGTSNKEWSSSYFDDPRDQIRVRQGIRIYKQKYKYDLWVWFAENAYDNVIHGKRIGDPVFTYILP